MIKLKTSYLIAGAVIITAMAVPAASFAHGFGKGTINWAKTGITRVFNGGNRLAGTVTAVSGTTLAVTDAKGTVYAVDASGAKIGNAADGMSLANILVGDKVMVIGKIDGTSDAATMITDLSFIGRNVFMGTVTAVNGTGLTIDTMANKTKTSYAVDASAAVVTSWSKGASTTIAISDVKVGDRIAVEGALNGTTIAAASVRDLGQPMRGPKSFAVKTGKAFGGTVTAVNGQNMAITAMNGGSYTIDASAATLTKGMGKDAAALALSDVKIGDRVFAVGTLSGTTIAASSVRDLGQSAPHSRGSRWSGRK